MPLSYHEAALRETPHEPSDETSEAGPASPSASDGSVVEVETIVAEAPASPAVDVARLSHNELRAIKRQMIDASIEEYEGPCPCPYNTMGNGRECDGRSAYSRPGGESPLCYDRDITIEMLREFLERDQ